ncbi:MAG: hypothetical protein A3C88_00200 [Candidatus Yanofskybacteria bacterium RIFCSPHIGHO2_02_FULL_50_12]|uniref:Glycosyltransferase 2-like domain-containing protein n=1 Tax=Candidatus Yanofskybacteria bacterium RIFCSPHIGHO2_02_FULL_50_12 TaxID=1802685 RepID=A0A1F8FUS0_9BACT|nr:MAG: hypothetical protein A3C88_00200 [Candidatus Yanofskybacteria bacterium RIFCSPHIGHO2_02_FULL_50_12]
MTEPAITINLVVLNGEKYIRRCLDSILIQSFDHRQIGINILDNGSGDNTVEIIKEYLSRFDNFHHAEFIQGTHNRGMWGGHEELWKRPGGEFVVVLSVDVVMHQDFIKNSVGIMKSDSAVGALQGKTYQMDSRVIDTCGFRITRSRAVMNIGHGESDDGRFDQACEIFGAEGAVPVFRMSALESIRVMGEIVDHDLFWYGEDLDVAWRVRLAGWKERYEPSVIAWHDRQTTKSHAGRGWLARIARLPIRRQIPIRRRQLEWRNTRWTRLKNDYIINILRDLPFIVWREIQVLGYTILFEPRVLAELPHFMRLLPRMLRKRREILSQALTTPNQIHNYFS